MRWARLASTAFVATASAYQQWDSLLLHVSADASFVTKLTSDNFDDIINTNELVLVKFFAPWCGHCKTLAPEYERAAETLKQKGSSIVLAELDATQESEIADTHEIHGFPTLKLFRSRKPEDYGGGRSSALIVDWVESMTGPAVIELEEDFKVYSERENITLAFIGSFTDKTHASYLVFHAVANSSRALGKFFAYFSGGHPEGIHVYRKEDGTFQYTGDVTEADLLAYFERESLADFGSISSDNYRKYAESPTDMVWFCGEEEHYEKAKTPVKAVAKENRATHSFVFLDTSKFRTHAENALGVSTFPAMVVQTKTFRYVMPGYTADTDSNKIAQFLEDIKNGKVEPSLKSEPIPETNDGAVKVVVGKTFKEMVLSPDHDVLFEVYAPWCGHCKKLEPIFVEFAETMRNKNTKLRVCKMDGTLNEPPVPNFEWTGFPTIFFIKAGSNEPMKYNGDRTVAGFTDYISKHGSVETPSTETPTTVESGKSEEL